MAQYPMVFIGTDEEGNDQYGLDPRDERAQATLAQQLTNRIAKLQARVSGMRGTFNTPEAIAEWQRRIEGMQNQVRQLDPNVIAGLTPERNYATNITPSLQPSGGRVPLTQTTPSNGVSPAPIRIAPGFEGEGQLVPPPGVDVSGINVPFAPGTINPSTGTAQPGAPRRPNVPGSKGMRGAKSKIPTTREPLAYEDFVRHAPQRLQSIFKGGTAPVTAQSRLPRLSGQDRAGLMPTERRALNASVLAMGMDPQDYAEQTRRLFAPALTGSSGSGSTTRLPFVRVPRY